MISNSINTFHFDAIHGAIYIIEKLHPLTRVLTNLLLLRNVEESAYVGITHYPGWSTSDNIIVVMEAEGFTFCLNAVNPTGASGDGPRLAKCVGGCEGLILLD